MKMGVEPSLRSYDCPLPQDVHVGNVSLYGPYNKAIFSDIHLDTLKQHYQIDTVSHHPTEEDNSSVSDRSNDSGSDIWSQTSSEWTTHTEHSNDSEQEGLADPQSDKHCPLNTEHAVHPSHLPDEQHLEENVPSKGHEVSTYVDASKISAVSRCPFSSQQWLRGTSSTLGQLQPASETQATQVPPVNRRRSGTYDARNGPPCKLKRDLEGTDSFVAMLIIFATRLITSIWPLSACPPMTSTCFNNGAGVLPLRVFIQETLRRSKTSYSTLQVALYYLILLKENLPQGDFTREQSRCDTSPDGQPTRPACRAMQCGRRMFLAALMLASKYLQDRNYSSRAWSKISGLRTYEINENEMHYLGKINYSLHMTKEEFDNWSKIVLSLANLSKFRPTCRESDSSWHHGNHGNGPDQLLGDMVLQASSFDPTEGKEVYSEKWWSDLLGLLEPGIVKDSKKVEAFLRVNLPMDQLVEPLSPLDHVLSTEGSECSKAQPPPKTDLNFSEAFGPAVKSQAVQTSGSTSSPVNLTSLPLRPQLRNLPTPQSTPRVAETCHRTLSSKKLPLRCAASLDALRSMPQQCLRNANLDRCPPPRPTSMNLPPVKQLVRPAAAYPECFSRSTTPSTSSPLSISSESSRRTTRSRSSSISSNSSWSSLASAPSQTSKFTFCAAQFGSPLAIMTSSSNDRNVQGGIQKPPTSQPIMSMECEQQFELETHFEDEGYGSSYVTDESIARNARLHSDSSSKEEAAQTLVSFWSQFDRPKPRPSLTRKRSSFGLNVQNRALATVPSIGHKRSFSRSDDNLQTHVRESLSTEDVSEQVVEDNLPTTYQSFLEKEWQPPARDWAQVKKPIPNHFDTKRLATYWPQGCPPAADAASAYLKDHLITV